MARTRLLLVFLVCAVSASQLRTARGAGAAPAPAPDCISLVLNNLTSCFDFAMSNKTNPGSDCCKSVRSFVKEAPSCVCTLLAQAGSLSSSYGINATKVMQLPELCNAPAHLDQCKTISMPPSNGPMPSGSGSPPPSGSQSNAPPPGSQSNSASATFWVSSLLAWVAAATAVAVL